MQSLWPTNLHGKELRYGFESGHKCQKEPATVQYYEGGLQTEAH